MSALATLEEFKGFLGIGARSTTTRDVALQLALDAGSDWVRQQLNSDITIGNYDEAYDGNGLSYIYLRNIPVVVSPLPVIEENGVALVVATGYSITADAILNPSTGSIRRQAGPTFVPGAFPPIPDRWSEGAQNVHAVYQGGYSAVPTPYKQIALYIAARFWKESDGNQIGILSRATGSHSTSFLTTIPDAYRDILRRNKRVFYAQK